MFNPKFRNPAEAFQNALATGELTHDKNSERYVGGWMYMHTDEDGKDAFKNIISRRYIHVANTNAFVEGSVTVGS